MALTCKPFGDIITFTRASTATYFDSAGVLQSAAIDAPRFDYNPSTLAARGLLIEEARTNLLLQSEDFSTTWTTSASPTITTNTTVAPDGTTTADTITSTSTSSYVAQIVTFTGDGTKTYSIFIKAGTSGNTRLSIRDTTALVSRGQADITWAGSVPSVSVTNGSLQALQACPNGWYRLQVIVDSVIAANTNQLRIQPDNTVGTGSVIFWGAQIENAAFSTSYIPTTTTALTRSADVASVNTLTPWFNSSQGTLFTEALLVQPPSTTVNQLSALSDNTNNNRIQLGASTASSGNLNFLITDTSVLQANPLVGSISTVGPHKAAGGYLVNSVQVAVNGALGTEDTSATIPASISVLNIGAAGNPNTRGNLWVRRITYYPRRLSNAELQSLTS